MKLETILNAMQRAIIQRDCFDAFTPMWHKRYRQAKAFRARILQMFEEKDEEIEYLIDANLAMYRQLTELQHRYKFKMEDWVSLK